MYKPPENCNRVKSIKSKFENIQTTGRISIPTTTTTNSIQKNGPRHNLTIFNHNNNIKNNKTELVSDRNKLFLSRQLSDPAKRNIKRTPAFRLDRNNCEKNQFQRDAPHNRSYFENKVKQFNTSALLKPDCDTNNRKLIVDKNIKNSELLNLSTKKPVLIKSKSSHDFAYIRSKFDKTVTNSEEIDQRREDSSENDTISLNNRTCFPDLSLLYTEPIPKSLRAPSDNNGEKPPESTIYNTQTLKISEPQSSKKDNLLKSDFSDTLKLALNRPLPTGPAPRKPPRTFEHTTKEAVLAKNVSFLHLEKDDLKTKPLTSTSTAKKSTKRDPRYMLNKLENALRNNIIKKQNTNDNKSNVKADTTSGEDSDDSVLFRSKSKKRLPHNNSNSSISSSFNCLNGLTSCATTYERIPETNSSFFVSPQKSDEPVYAEPFNHFQFKKEKDLLMAKNNTNRNSLHYMSTALLEADGKCLNNYNLDESLKQDLFLTSSSPVLNSKEHKMSSHKQMSAENSSLSSFTSDLDSATSTPQDENNSFETAVKIKHLIDAFETQKMTQHSNGISPVKTDDGNRIDSLKINLQQTLDKCFNCESSSNETKSNVDQIVNKFQTYVRTNPKYAKPKIDKNDRLFDCCLIVSWDLNRPQIKCKFPKNTVIPDRIEDLCFPEAASGPLDQSDNAQCYSLLITNDRGERTFGYCRRVIPEGSTRCIPLAYCILSKHRAPRFYKKILIELESRHGIPNKLRDELISAFYYNKFPRPGESIKINLASMINELNEFKNNQQKHLVTCSIDLNEFVCVRREAGDYGVINRVSSEILESDGEKTELTLTLHPDARYEESDIKPLHNLPADVLLKIFASLLLERKVILISCMISKLSCCVDALQSILYPFSWPHTFIPILPECLWDVVESPTPVVCGILSVAVVNQHKIEHGIVVDLDEGNILCEEGDENSILSNSMKKAWLQGIESAKSLTGQEYVYSVYLSDAYIRVFIVALKHYKNHIINGNFEKENFIKSGKTKGIRRFLKWFTDTTLFSSFIELVISNPDSFRIFDSKIEMYGSDQSNDILAKLFDWKK